MFVRRRWTTHQVVVHLDEEEATRIAALLMHVMKIGPEPEDDAAAQLESALKEVLA